jgi:hypothetical protein
MQEIFSHGLIGAHRESELALRPGETARSLDKPMPQRVEFFKGPWIRDAPRFFGLYEILIK